MFFISFKLTLVPAATAASFFKRKNVPYGILMSILQYLGIQQALGTYFFSFLACI